ncbi:hypothetical protein B0H67DRAFT_650536 [Lasiosphaeris hirsuta]|uniref:Uncharacterized protein n=1 Tax=Lasiosphaeris hirsuta TaxID=260670 RepID=A0AA39ZPK8_9PEZI|nr:hypothetical protein B0H67DRAFT_650536 [Lasiosphaeris hirsuta]
MKVFLTQELVPSPGLENLLRVTKEIADQRAPALRYELSMIRAQHDGNLGPASRQEYSLKATYEKAKAATLERGRFRILSETLRRDTERIAELTAQVSRESSWVDHSMLESSLTALDQLVQGVSDRRVTPCLGAMGNEGSRQNGAAHDERGSTLSTMWESTTMDQRQPGRR